MFDIINKEIIFDNLSFATEMLTLPLHSFAKLHSLLPTFTYSPNLLPNFPRHSSCPTQFFGAYDKKNFFQPPIFLSATTGGAYLYWWSSVGQNISNSLLCSLSGFRPHILSQILTQMSSCLLLGRKDLF